MKLLDLYCGAGGAGAGYRAAGFDVTGIDIKPQPRYPFDFIQFDVTRMSTAFLRRFDVIHASPPCQASSSLRHLHKDIKYKDLVPLTRNLLREARVPYVIENVNGAELFAPLMLCGTMFGLQVTRHRLFESNLPLRRLADECEPGGVKSGRYFAFVSGSGPRYDQHGFRAEMGVEWMTIAESRQAIPPAYTEYVGRQVRDSL